MALLTKSVDGQRRGHNFVNITVEQGLPSNQIFDAFQDSKGYMWFGTDRGLVRYNGFEFEVFTTKNGLSSNTNLFIDESNDGRLWIYGDDGRLTYFDHKRFWQFKYNSNFLDQLHPSATPLYLDASGTIPELGYSVEQSGSMNSSKISANSVSESNTQGIYLEDDGVEINLHLRKVLNRANYPIYHIQNGDTLMSVVTVNNNLFEGESGAVKIKGLIYFSYKNQLYTYKKGDKKAELIANFPEGILSLARDNHGNLYVGLYKKGLYKLEEAKASRAVEFIPGISVSSIFIDRNDGVWIGSLFNGIFFSQESKDLHYSTVDKGAFLEISGNRNRIIAVDNQNKVLEVKADKLELLDEGFLREIRCVDLDPDGCLRLGSSGLEGRVIYDTSMSKSTYEHHGFSELLRVDTLFWCVHKDGMFRLSSDLKDTIGSNIDHPFPINSLAMVSRDTLLVGSKAGAFILLHDQLIPYRHDHPFYRGDIVSILAKDDLLILSSRDQGIRIEKGNHLVAELDEGDGLISGTINDAQLIDDKLLISSNRGISVLEMGNGIRNFSRSNGLISNAVNDVFHRNDTLWIATRVYQRQKNSM